MKNIGNTQERMNIIQQTVLLNKEEFKSLEYFIGYKADVVYVQPKQALNELSFCMNEKDIELLKETNPDMIKFVKQ